MGTPAQRIEWTDVQALAISGFHRCPHSLHLPLRITDPGSAKRWLLRLLDGGWVTAADKIAERSAQDPVLEIIVNLAITATGLAALGLSPEARASFPFEFQEGMTGTARRREMLGDVGRDAPGRWRWGHAGREAHLLVMIYAAQARMLAPDICWSLLPRPGGVTPVWSDAETPEPEDWSAPRTHLAADGTDHFGFRDGISQPLIEGTKAAEHRRYGPEELSIVNAGELLLGYRNERGLKPVSPVVDADVPVAKDLPRLAGGRELGANGSSLVVRQRAQDGFRVRRWSARSPATRQRSSGRPAVRRQRPSWRVPRESRCSRLRRSCPRWSRTRWRRTSPQCRVAHLPAAA